MARYPGAAGEFQIVTTPAGEGGTPPAVSTVFCIENWTDTETRAGQSSLTTCDWDDDEQVLYTNEDETTRGIEITIEGFIEDDVDHEDALKGKILEGVILRRTRSGQVKELELTRARITSIVNTGQGPNLQTYRAVIRNKGKFIKRTVAVA